MKKILFICMSLFSIIAWQSCDERDDIRKDVDDLNARLDAIQPLIIQLNKDIISYKALIDGKKWITEYSVNDIGDYTINFNDGSSMIVYSGVAESEVPQLGIGEDGWYYTLNGEEYPLLGPDGKPAPVFGEDGVAPQMRINKKGRWEYSLDGINWQGDLGTAFPRNGISIFDEVIPSADGKRLTFKWHVGTTEYEKEIALFSGLDLVIDYGDEAFSPVVFTSGEMKTFPITQIGIDKALIETHTWGVQMNEHEIVITAPNTLCKEKILIKILSSEGYCKLVTIPVEVQ